MDDGCEKKNKAYSPKEIDRIIDKHAEARKVLMRACQASEDAKGDPAITEDEKRRLERLKADAVYDEGCADHSWSDRARDHGYVLVPSGIVNGQPSDPCTHSADFHSVRWYGQQYTFTHLQAAVVRLLWEARENGTPDLGQEYLLEESGSDSQRLRDIFKLQGGEMHPAWRAMIVESKKGVFRLSPPETRI